MIAGVRLARRGILIDADHRSKAGPNKAKIETTRT
jgi:hypothetical protein